MMLKKETMSVIVLLVIVFVTDGVWSQMASSSLQTRDRQERLSAGAGTPAVTNKREGSSFDQQRLIALFGSETQPVYGNRDPTTGQVLLIASAPSPPGERDPMESSLPADDVDPVDRKDTRVPETNEINPFELLPPQFHDLLNIPIHDYGNGTTYNPYDKYKSPAAPAKSKYPLVSTGYANTKYQGPPSSSGSSSTTKPIKPVGNTKLAGQAAPYDSDDYSAPNSNSNKKPSTTTIRTSTQPATTKKQRVRPSEFEREPETFAVYRPNKPQQVDTTRYKPIVRPSPYDKTEEPISTYRPDYYSKPESKPANSRPSYPSNDEEPEESEGFDDWPYPPPVEANKKPIDDFNPYQARPVIKDEFPVNRPTYSLTNRPVSYRPDDQQIAEIKVTPKPFYAAADNDDFNDGQQEERLPGQVEDSPDIIYDYDDERSKGEGVMFMFDNGPNGPSVAVNNRPVTPSPVASPYPTVASREPKPQQIFSPAFRPSPLVRPTGNFLPAPPSSAQNLPVWNSPAPTAQQKQINENQPRPPLFRFPSEQPTVGSQDNQAPNILPLFRPNTNPTDEFQFIKHPQQVDIQRQQQIYQPSLPGSLNRRPLNQPIGQDGGPSRQQQAQQRPAGAGPSGISPLPSALQSPFSSISQKVANFFGRRSGPSIMGFNRRSADLSPPSNFKMDRSGLIDPTETDEDLEMAESSAGPLFLFSQADQPPSSVSEVDRTGLSLQQHPAANGQQASAGAAGASNPQVVGIRAAPDAAGNKPPAFYVYTSRELEKGQPPYLVVGPVLSGPPSVSGAKLVHTAQAKPIQQSHPADRRSDGPSVDNGALFSPPVAPNQEILAARQSESHGRKPFFPIGNNNKADRLPTGLSPPRLQTPINNRRPPPGFLFPENTPGDETILPQGISPVSQGIPPPRVPLNPQKDIASLFSNPTLLHNRPADEFGHSAGVPQRVTDQGLPVASVLAVPLNDGPAVTTSRPLPPKRKPTKSPPRTTTTPIYMEAFNNPQPVTYDTIQQEDGKQIAVVHPAYIVTYKSRPGPPELIDLDAPFVPSIESPLLEEEGVSSSIEFEKWHAVPQEIKRKDEEPLPLVSSAARPSGTAESLEYHGGFIPVHSARK